VISDDRAQDGARDLEFALSQARELRVAVVILEHYEWLRELGVSMDPLSTFAAAALTQGVQFLYQQAAEFLSAWRARRHDKGAPPPRALDAPEGVTVTRPRPLADPPSEEAIRVLEQLAALVEPIQSGKIDPTSPAARAAVEQLRDVVEAALRAPVQLAGEPQRPVTIADINVVTERVAGRVAGLRGNLAKLPGGSQITGVHVTTGEVEAGGDVAGVDVT
jgi:hypothetical protein